MYIEAGLKQQTNKQKNGFASIFQPFQLPWLGYNRKF